MNYNLICDICALLILTTLSLLMVLKKRIKSQQNNLFLHVLVTEVFIILFDMCAAFYEGKNVYAVILFNYLYFFFHCTIAFMYSIYTAATLNYRVRWKSIVIPLIVPLCAEYVLICMNPFYGTLFSIDSNAVYHRGPMMLTLYLIFIYYILYCIITLVRNRKSIQHEKMLAIVPFITLLFSGTIIQFNCQYLLCEQFFYSLCLVISYFGLENSDELYEKQTGLLNRKSFLSIIGTKLVNKKTFNGIIISIHDADVITKSVGEEKSFQLLMSFISFLKQFSKDNMVFRVSNGSYCILPYDGDRETAYEIMKSVTLRMQEPFDVSDLCITLLSTCCMFECPHDASKVVEVLDIVKMSAEVGKIKKSAVISTAELDLRHTEYEKEIETKVKTAIADKRLEVYYQPIYSTSQHRYVAAEALLRMKDNEHGYISPDVFIPAAERNGTIIEIGRWVLEEVCRMISENDIRKLGIEYIEVNLSVVECIQDDLVEHIKGLLKKYDLDPKCINLEITETAADAFTQIVDTNVNELSKEGIEFSLDDFGTGYSSVNRIISMPLKIVKLDKTIVQPAFDSKNARTLLDCSVDMIKKLGLEIVAEGVETKEQAREIIKLGCDSIQGYYFSKPVPVNNFLKIIKEGGLPEL